VPKAVQSALEKARKNHSELALILQLRGSGAKPVPSPETTERLAQALTDRATAQSGHRANRMNVFRELGSFVVLGKADFLAHLVAQPEVASVKLNESHPSSVEPIRPVRTGPPSEDGWVDIDS